MDNLAAELDRAAEYIQNTWTSVVRGDGLIPGAPVLRFDTITQRNLYADSIVQGQALNMPEAGEFSRKILATSPMAEKTEQGYTAWDMKPMLLNGPKARVSKKGNVFNIIPFRHGVPGKSGDNAQFRNMPRNVYEAAKALKPTISVIANGRPRILKYGGSLNTKEHIFLLAKFGPQKNTKGYQHKTSIYEGMYKIQATYAKTVQSKYLTFRVVSEKSDPLSWWHPGRAAQPHVQFVVDYCMPTIERNVKQAVQNDFLIFQGLGMDVTVE